MFDTGVANALKEVYSLPEKTTEFGHAFEHFIILEIKKYLIYCQKRISMHYWRTYDGAEVDLILDEKIAIEIKSTDTVTIKHAKGLHALAKHKACTEYLLISRDELTVNLGDTVTPYYWEDFLQKLWNNEIV